MRSRYGVGCAYLTGWVLGGTSEPNGVTVPRFFILLIVALGLGGVKIIYNGTRITLS